MTTVVDDRGALRTGGDRAAPAVEQDARHWALAADAAQALRWRHAFRAYLVAFGHPASDFHGAELVYGELLANCVRHAPGPVRVEFRWADLTLVVVDARERLRSWPFSPEDWIGEATHHGFALLNALVARLHLAREPGGGTRASVVLPVLPR
jgi:anti-sigma regulatory factor (Ser/Thr protein kinase)